MNEHNAPKRLWLSAGDTDGEHQVWFDPDEGGTMYVRADLMLTPAALADALECFWNAALSAECQEQTTTQAIVSGVAAVAFRLKESVND